MVALPAADARRPDPATVADVFATRARAFVPPSKLRPAVNPAYLLPRPRLHALLDTCVAAPVTLVVAPAGSGKTSLLRSWAADSDLPLAWLSLDADDRDPVQLWRAVLVALDAVAPGCARAAAPLLHRTGGVPAAVGALLDDLESCGAAPSVLVVDDLQLVDEADAVASSLSLFVQHLPAWLHLVMASRRTPRLPVDRLRARGQLGEVHFPELRFSFDEAAAMLARLAPDLDADTVAEVAGRAGGWAASIQLAALAARSAHAQARPYVAAHGVERQILEDYVWHEVLANESEDVVEVLLATSVVQHVDPDLAGILSGRPDAADLLLRAEQRGLFVARTEPAGFEVHALVREALLAVLAERSPARLVRLHGWAAGWHEAHGETGQALEHWLRAERPRDALRLLALRAAELYDGGNERVIRRTVGSLPDAVVAADVEAMVEFAWVHLLVDRRRYVSLVDGLEVLVRDDLGLDAVVDARIEVLRSIACTLRGHWEDGASIARSALETFGDSWWLDPLGQFAWNMIARDAALAERWDDAGPEARGVVRTLGVVPERRIALEGSRALGQALSGHPVDALRLVAGARQASVHTPMTILRLESLAAEAVAHRELGDLAIALPQLTELADVRVEPGSHCQLLALLELTQARIGAGDLTAAEEVFGRAAELVDTEMPGPGARSWLGRGGTALCLAAGDLDGARAWSTQVMDPFWSGVVRARTHLSAGEPGAAADALKTAEPRCDRHRVILELQHFRVAEEGRGAAQRHLLQAVRLAATRTLVQTVADEGPFVVEAVERLAWPAPLAWVDRLRRTAQGALAAGSLTVGLEELTEREVEVLRMLPSRLTLREIADELFISINTLKFHLKVIYRKLGCTSRAEASEVARAMTSLRRSAQPPSTRRRWTS